MIEAQLKQHLFHVRHRAGLRIVGKCDENDKPCLPPDQALSSDLIAEVLVARDVPTIHLSLRSSELVAGASGGPRTEEDARHHLEKTERVLAYAVHTLGAIPRTLMEFHAIYAGGG